MRLFVFSSKFIPQRGEMSLMIVAASAWATSSWWAMDVRISVAITDELGRRLTPANFYFPQDGDPRFWRCNSKAIYSVQAVNGSKDRRAMCWKRRWSAAVIRFAYSPAAELFRRRCLRGNSTKAKRGTRSVAWNFVTLPHRDYRACLFQ